MNLYDFNAEIKNLDGSLMIRKQEEKKKIPLLLKDVVVNALLADYKDEYEPNGNEKMRRFLLAQKIYESTEPIHIVPDDIVLIKLLIPQVYNTLIGGQSLFLIKAMDERKYFIQTK